MALNQTFQTLSRFESTLSASFIPALMSKFSEDGERGAGSV